MGSPNYNVGKDFEAGISHDVHLAESAETCKEIGRVLAPGGIVAINIADIHNFPIKGKGNESRTRFEPMVHKWAQMFRRHRINLTDILIWQKNTIWTPPRHFKVFNEDTVHTSYRFLHNYEYVLIFRKEGERELPPEDVVLQSRISKEQFVSWAPAVWHIHSVWKNEGHPTQYPDELCYRLIKMFSYEGDTVVDPWLGSGTTIKVARELNRVGIGYERDLRYKEVIMKKLGVEPEVAVAEKSEVTMSEFAQSQLDDTLAEAGKFDDQVSLDQPQPKAEFFTNDPSMLENATVEVSA
jgi:DNA modification methylase